VAEKKPTIVIKKITIVAGGGHGGAWKVAFADFMTAMMAFFLVMWLMATSSKETKEAVSDYFSTPSVIEYSFANYGVELTLEKLFLDLINEPLKTIQSFVEPMDKTPNLMAMGMKKVVMAYMADQLGAVATNVEISSDTVVFEIPDEMIFQKGTALPTGEFVEIMERVKGVTAGLEDSDLIISSVVFRQALKETDTKVAVERGKKLADERLDLVQAKVKGSLENESVDIRARSGVKNDDRPADKKTGGGYIRFEIKQKQVLPDGKKPKPIENGVFGAAEADKSVYDNFVQQVSKQNTKQKSSRGGAKGASKETLSKVEKQEATKSESESHESSH